MEIFESFYKLCSSFHAICSLPQLPRELLNLILEVLLFVQLALAYNEALLEGRFPNSRGGIIQSTFLGSLRKRVEELLNHCSELENDLQNYLKSGRWPNENSQHRNPSTLLALYLKWYGVPPPSAVKTAIEKIKRVHKSSSVPLLRLLFPRTHVNAIREIDKLCFSPQVFGLRPELISCQEATLFRRACFRAVSSYCCVMKKQSEASFIQKGPSGKSTSMVYSFGYTGLRLWNFCVYKDLGSPIQSAVCCA